MFLLIGCFFKLATWKAQRTSTTWHLLFPTANQTSVSQVQTPDVPSILKQRKPSSGEEGDGPGDQVVYCPPTTLVGEEEEEEEGEQSQLARVSFFLS